MAYIENDFPIEEIDEIAWSESNPAGKKPIYLLHKWFARRVGCTFRALILGTFLEDNPMKYYYQKIELKNREGKPPLVLDPFMGGGTTIVEGNRLGCKMIGVDINPLAWFITKKELENVDIKKVREEFTRIEKSVKDKILSYYKTKCNHGHNANIMYVFWAKKVKCENCKREVPLYKSFIIATPRNKNFWVYQCPKCGEIFHDKPDLKNIQCPSCAHEFDPNAGFATGKTYRCQYCRYEGEVLSAVRKSQEPPEHEMFAIEYYCPICGRDYKKPTVEDIEVYMEAKKEFEKKKGELLGRLIPDEKIPEGFNTNQMRNFNYTHWYQMFNERQLLCLSMLLEEIFKIKENYVREVFLTMFSDMLNTNNMFCIYHLKNTKIESLFGGHHFWPPAAPVENNVWGLEIGTNNFIKEFNKSLSALEYQMSPFEVFSSKNKKNQSENINYHKKIKILNEKINGKFAKNFNEIREEKNVLLKCDTAENLKFIPDRCIDAVITDPPYYDNIMYSELSDFFYVWLRLGLKDTYPEVFSSPLSRKDREIVVNKAQGKGEEFYIEGMARVFREVHRVLKDDGIMAFVFQHKKTEAWAAVLKALLKAGFYVVAVYPTHGETPSGVRRYGINYNSILVCKKLLARKPEEIPWVIFESELRSKVDGEIGKILERHPDLELEDAFIIAMGKALEVYSQNYGNIVKDGNIFDITEISLEIIGDLVFNSLLRHILAKVPDVDRLSKIYAAVFSRKEKITNDTINKLTRHGGIETTIFEDEKLIKKEKNNGVMEISPPEEREELIMRKIERGLPITYIDGGHLLWVARERDKNFDKTLELILRSGLNRNRLEEYVRFLSERTDSITWKKIENTLKTTCRKPIEEYGREE